MKHTIYLIAAMALAAGCTTLHNMGEVLLPRTDISLTYKGEVQITFDPETYQLGYNDINNEYRVYDDKLSNWFTITCSEKPVTVGQEISADVAWADKSSTTKMQKLEFRVEKTANDGMVWLWCASKSIGIIIRNL